MVHRCTNPKMWCYMYYGAIGITVCKRWVGKNGFMNFLDDMGERPLGKTLDRVDSNSGYKPSNCRWATKEEQITGRRKHPRKNTYPL